MPKVGDRVIIEGAKIGQQRREGSLVGITGSLLNVRWIDGTSSLLTPGAGSITFLPAGGSKPSGAKKVSTGKIAGKTRNSKPAAKKAAAAKTAGAKKAGAKKAGAKKPAGIKKGAAAKAKAAGKKRKKARK